MEVGPGEALAWLWLSAALLAPLFGCCWKKAAGGEKTAPTQSEESEDAVSPPRSVELELESRSFVDSTQSSAARPKRRRVGFLTAGRIQRVPRNQTLPWPVHDERQKESVEGRVHALNTIRERGGWILDPDQGTDTRTTASPKYVYVPPAPDLPPTLTVTPLLSPQEKIAASHSGAAPKADPPPTATTDVTTPQMMTAHSASRKALPTTAAPPHISPPPALVALSLHSTSPKDTPTQCD